MRVDSISILAVYKLSILSLGLVLLWGCPQHPPSDDSVRQSIEDLATYLDSDPYAEAVSWREHVVLCYRLAQDREPTDIEFAFLDRLRDDPGIRRSQVLSLALGGDDSEVSWETSRQFFEQHRQESFRADEEVAAVARRMERDSNAQVIRALAVTSEESRRASEHLSRGEHGHTASEAGVEYETYFGFLHAHSHLSDGEGGALEAYEFARDQGGLDFFALTDHGINLFVRWPWEDKWQELKDAAEATHDPGTYVTFWGFEWSNPLLGHVSIINTEDYTHTLSDPRMPDLYRWLVRHPEAFARFNHPGRYGADALGFEIEELGHFALHPEAISQMVGLELWNKDNGFDRYYYAGSWGDDPRSFLDLGIQKGWQLGTLGGQDNHEKEWGTRNDFRTAVLARELTREALIDAYTKRRIYATEDKDLFLDVRASGFPMGSRVQGIEASFQVTARDGSGDEFEKVRLFRNGLELFATQVSGPSFSVSFTDPAPTGADYYYVIVTQESPDEARRGDEAISSPIWIDAQQPL